MSKRIEIASGVITLAVGSLILNPIGAAVFDKVMHPILADFMERMLSTNQKNRIEKVLEDAINKIASRLEKNEIPSIKDGSWTEDSNRISDAKVVLEGVLLKARDEYEEKNYLIIQILLHKWLLTLRGAIKD